MPIYEFFCPKNSRIYSFFARSLSYSSKTPRCPDGPEWPMEKMLSGFAITGRAKEKSGFPDAEGMDDPRMEKALAEMEREFSSVGDSENPDPRTLARMMRRMAELGGNNVPPMMQEMIARLERGEDPEKLEAEYGDMMGDFDEAMGDSPEEQAVAATLRKRRNPVTRDPKLYEMSEFCD
jgi:hypothetical protein